MNSPASTRVCVQASCKAPSLGADGQSRAAHRRQAQLLLGASFVFLPTYICLAVCSSIQGASIMEQDESYWVRHCLSSWNELASHSSLGTLDAKDFSPFGYFSATEEQQDRLNNRNIHSARQLLNENTQKRWN